MSLLDSIILLYANIAVNSVKFVATGDNEYAAEQ